MPGASWRVIHVAKNPETAQKLLDLLESEGILARVHPLQSEGAQGPICEIRVLRSEAEEALKVLLERTI